MTENWRKEPLLLSRKRLNEICNFLFNDDEMHSACVGVRPILEKERLTTTIPKLYADRKGWRKAIT